MLSNTDIIVKNAGVSGGEAWSSSGDLADKAQASGKQLPLWLREGLEKIKQEKQRKEVDRPAKTEPKLVSGGFLFATTRALSNCALYLFRRSRVSLATTTTTSQRKR